MRTRPTRRPFTRSFLCAPKLLSLEDRTTPTTLYGLTSTNTLVTFDSATPGTAASTVAVTGLAAGDTLVGIDTRPATGQLYGLGSKSDLYTINPTTGAATAVGTGFTPALSGTSFGFDFNPTVDKIRVVSNTGQDLRLDPTTGAVVATDTTLFYDTSLPENSGYFGSTAPPAPQVTAAAYTKNTDPSGANTVTTLYGIDTSLDTLVRIGGPDGSPSPNAGQVAVIGSLGFDATDPNGFDIEAGTDTAYFASGSKLYSVNITTGAGTLVGAVAGGVTLQGLAIAAPAAGAGAVQLASSTLSFPANRAPLVVSLTRTGGATGAVTVNYATADGSAVGGTDYLPASGTVTFAAGQTTQVVVLALPNGPTPAGPAKTFTLTLSAPTGGATLGATAATTVTIPAVTGTLTGKFFAAGAGPGGGPQVNVYDAVSGTLVGTFSAFESSFTGGVRVATGDVNGDGVDDIVVGTGNGGSPRVRVFDGASLLAAATASTPSTATPTVLADFFAYESTFTGGVNVAVGDVNGDGYGDLLIGSGIGGGPRVRVIDGASLTSTNQTGLADFFAYESSFRGGVNVASGELTKDGYADVIAGSGVGGGPRVRVFDGKGLLTNTSSTPSSLSDYFAYESSFRNGVNVAAGDVNGDGVADVVTGPGAGGGPLVEAFSGSTATNIAGFFAYDSSLRTGVNVATTDLGADGTYEIVTGTAGPGALRFFNAAGASAAADAQPFGSSFTGGVFVG